MWAVCCLQKSQVTINNTQDWNDSNESYSIYQFCDVIYTVVSAQLVGYALYYSSFKKSELWQFEPTLTHPTIHTISYKSMCIPQTNIQVAKETNLMTQAVRTAMKVTAYIMHGFVT